MKFALRPMLRLTGAALSALPTAPSAWMAETILGKNMFKTLHRAGYPETAERLLLHRLAIPPKKPLYSGTILIVGTARIGKSTIAREVAKALHMRALSTDDVAPRVRTHAATRELLVQICEKASGLVLEGKALALNVLSEEGSAALPLAFDPIVLQNGNLRTFVVGCCTSSTAIWESVLRTHAGWLATRDEEYIRRFASRIGERNRELRGMALAAGVEYFEIPREDFSAAIDRTVEAIVARVRMES